MKGILRQYLTFTKSERIGIILLFSVIVIIILVPHFLPEKTINASSADELYKIEVNKYLQELKKEQSGHRTYQSISPVDKSYRTNSYLSRFKPQPFDPNTISAQGYMEMGFSEKQAASMVKYREKGGRFVTKQDFNKLYVVDDETYAIFKAYISLPDTEEIETSELSSNKDVVEKFTGAEGINSNSRSSSKLIHVVELNSADSLQLISINGIGPVFASRIIKFREKIGGFARVEQLMDVYGIDSTRFPALKPQVRVDTTMVVKLKINKVTLQELKSHPYFQNYYLAKAVIDRRIQKGGFKRPDEIKDLFKNRIDVFNKLIPYLDFSFN
ncbi:MAG: helix-hairpin-helix domain-containing protein [Chloroflexota bacterium]